jgi:hypothetical protein
MPNFMENNLITAEEIENLKKLNEIIIENDEDYEKFTEYSSEDE